jgi:lysozyme
MHTSYVDAIRTFEGFVQKARWDYAQLTNGYGTRAAYPGEVIDRAEADRRFLSAVANARAIVERHGARLDEGTKAALTSLTYNTGDAWVRSGLGDAVRRGDLDEVRTIFLRYNKAGGEVLPGLVSRRAAEALWIGNPQLVGAEPSAAAIGSDVDHTISVPAGVETRARVPEGADVGGRGVEIVARASAEARLSKLMSAVSEPSASSPSAVGPPRSGYMSDVARLMMLDMGYELLAHRSDRQRDRDSSGNA